MPWGPAPTGLHRSYTSKSTCARRWPWGWMHSTVAGVNGYGARFKLTPAVGTCRVWQRACAISVSCNFFCREDEEQSGIRRSELPIVQNTRTRWIYMMGILDHLLQEMYVFSTPPHPHPNHHHHGSSKRLEDTWNLFKTADYSGTLLRVRLAHTPSRSGCPAVPNLRKWRHPLMGVCGTH